LYIRRISCKNDDGSKKTGGRTARTIGGRKEILKGAVRPSSEKGWEEGGPQPEERRNRLRVGSEGSWAWQLGQKEMTGEISQGENTRILDSSRPEGGLIGWKA